MQSYWRSQCMLSGIRMDAGPSMTEAKRCRNFGVFTVICHCAGPCYYKSDGCNKWAFFPMLQS